MKGLSNTQRTLRELRNQGRICDIVERWVKFSEGGGCRKDLFGIIDILALDPARGIVGIQSTSGNCTSQHKKKLFEEKSNELAEWLKAGGKFELWSWRKVKLKRGGKAERWSARVEELLLENVYHKNAYPVLVKDDINNDLEEIVETDSEPKTTTDNGKITMKYNVEMSR